MWMWREGSWYLVGDPKPSLYAWAIEKKREGDDMGKRITKGVKFWMGTGTQERSWTLLQL